MWIESWSILELVEVRLVVAEKYMWEATMIVIIDLMDTSEIRFPFRYFLFPF